MNKQIEEMSKIFESTCDETECNKPTNCDLCQATRLYNAGYRKQEWISVEDRLPDEEGEYLVFTCNKHIKVMPFFTKRDASAGVYGRGFCVWGRGSRTNDDDWWVPVKYVTHWQPLPQPPK